MRSTLAGHVYSTRPKYSMCSSSFGALSGQPGCCGQGCSLIRWRICLL